MVSAHGVFVTRTRARANQIQSGLYIAGGGNLFDWTQQMRHSLAELRAGSARIATYIWPGNGHCGVLESPNWYWTASVRFYICVF